MAVTLGADINIVPAPTLQTTGQNYIDFRASGTAGWAQQHMPEIYDAEIERYLPYLKSHIEIINPKILILLRLICLLVHFQ